MEWKITNIGSLCNRVCSGGTPKSTNNAYYNGNIPWLNTKEVNFNRIYDTEKNITQLGLENSSAKWISENSVIVAMYGATAGKVAITKIPITTNQACCNLSINSEIADYNFVYYFLCSKFYELSSLANGGAQQNLNAQIIKDFPIKIPVNLSDQRKIAGILSALDAKIENNNKINANLEAQAQALFKSWFVDFTPFKDQPFVDSELGPIPQGWKVGKLGDYCEVKSGYAFKSSWWTNKGYKIIKIKNISENGDINLNDCSCVLPENCDKAKNFIANTGDIVIAMTGATIGKFNIIPKIDEKFYINQRVGKFFLGEKPIEKVPYIYCFLKQENISTQIIQKGQGSAQPNISGADIESIPMLTPMSIILKYNKMCQPLFEKILSNRLESKKLSALRDTLLPKLMSGEIKL